MNEQPTDQIRREGDPEYGGSAAEERRPPPDPLTDREMEVLQCLPTRLSVIEIGAALEISPNTVKSHLRSIYAKLGVKSRNDAILQGAKYRLVAKDSERLVRP